VTHNERPYMYKMNRKKREVVKREGLDNDEEEVEDISAMGNIEDIFHSTFENKTIGHRFWIEEGSPFQILISVEPTTPCVTKTNDEEKLVNQ